MKHFIKVKDGVVLEYLGGVYEDIPNEYIEITEEDAKICMCGKPLKYINGKVIVDKDAVKKMEAEDNIKAEIDLLTMQLSNTDYIVIKIAEGVATEEEYADILKDRAEWRKRINEIEGELK